MFRAALDGESLAPFYIDVPNNYRNALKALHVEPVT